MPTKIEWTEETWNPLTGCTKVSPGCDHCYAKTMHERFNGPGSFDTVTLHPGRLDQPLHWRRPRRIFVNSMSDLFHKDVPDDYIARVFAVMALAPQHTFQVLTKRHGRMRSLLSSDRFAELYDQAVGDARHFHGWVTAQQCNDASELPLRNVWLGVSVENQQWANIRIPALLDTPAAVRFLSCEPLLGPVDLGGFAVSPDDGTTVTLPIDWVIAGGESGHGARPMHPDWARTLRDQCQAAGVPFLFKQWGESRPLQAGDAFPDKRIVSVNREVRGYPSFQLRVGKKRAGRHLDGRTWDQYPAEVTA